MSADPIDIKITDSVPTSVRDKLLNLAQAALEASNGVDRVQAALDRVNPGGLNKLVSLNSQLASSSEKLSSSYLNQEIALNKAIAAENKAATSAERLAAAQSQAQAASAVAASKQAQATQRLAEAAARAETAQIRAAAASAKQAQAATAAATAVNAFGESEAQVAARLAGVAQAGASLARQQENIASTATQAATAEKTLAAATTASGNAAAQAAQRYGNYMSALNTINKNQKATPTANLGAATAGIQNNVTALNGLAAANTNVGQTVEVSNRSILKGIIAYKLYSGAINLVSEAIAGYFSAASDFQNLQNKLNQVATSQAEVNRLTIELLEVANRSRAPLESVGTTFQRISQALKSVGGSEREAIQITEALTKATAVAGLTASEQASALLQVSQAFNKGKLDGDEFRSVMENFPQFGDAIAKSLGLANKGLLFEAAKQGKINLDVMRDAMIKLGDAADQQLGKATLTVDQAFTKLKNSATVLIGELDRALGVTSLLAKGLNYLAEVLERSAKANAQTGTATLAAVNQDNLNKINAQVEAQEQLIATGKAGVAGQNKLNKLYEIQLNLQNKIQENAQDSLKTVREMDNAADKAFEAGKQGAFATALTAVNKEMDTLKVGTHKADEELKTYRKNLEALGKSAKDLGTPEALKAFTDAKALQSKAEAEIIRRNSLKTPAVKATPDEKRDVVIAKATAELDKQLKVYGDIRSERDAMSKLDQIEIELATKTTNGRLTPLKALTAAEKEEIKTKLAQIEVNKRVEAAQDAIYQNVQGPQQRLQDGQIAINNLLDKHRISATQAAEAQRALNYAFDAATDPLFLFNKELKQQNELLESGLDAKQRAAKGTVNQINNQLAPQGKKLDDDQVKQVEALVTANQHLIQVTQAYDQIVGANRTVFEDMTAQQEALNKAYNNGIISTQQYAQATTQLAIEKAKLNLELGNGTFADAQLSAVSKLIDGYKNLLSGLSTAFGDFFVTLEDGFANSIGKAIVYGDSLKQSLIDVARQGVAALISSLVKLGVQYLINATLGKSIQAASLAAGTATSVAAAATVATAWAPAAALTSLASFGANSIPASEGLAATVALSELLAGASLFKEGGYTGNGGVNDVAGLVHGKEFVSNAAATSANRGTLEYMNRGGVVGSDGGGGNIHVSIQNTGTPQDYDVQQISRTEIALIARDVVSKEAAKVVASDLNNPNSQTSKSIARNTTIQRKR